MAFPTKDTFTFDFETQADYPSWTPEQTKEYLNARGEELRLALNAVANLLNATTSDVSGADNLGIPETVAGSGTNVRDRADWLYALIINAVLGQIPDNSLTVAKLAFDPATQEELDTHLNDAAPHNMTFLKAETGYQKLPSGIIMQWGYVVSSATPNTFAFYDFPTPFPNALFAVSALGDGSLSTATIVQGGGSATQVALVCNIASQPIRYIAFGH